VFRRLSPLVFLALLALPCPTFAQDPPKAGPVKARQKLYITNSAGNDVTVVDLATNKVITTIDVGPHPHGIAVPAAQDFILVTIEGGKVGEVVWIDPQTDKVTKRMECGPEPNQLAITPNGKFAYVPCKDGHWDVIDIKAAKVVERIFVGGRPHNTLVSKDGKRMYLGPMGDPHRVFVADTATHKIIAEIPFSSVIRPIALTDDEKKLYVEVDGLVGIEVADVAAKKMMHRIPANLTDEQKKVASRSHGLGITPDQKEVWACDVEHFEVQIYDVTGDKPKQVATIPMGGRVYWLTFSPDGKYCYVAVRSKNEAAVIDTKTRQIVARIPAGMEPKRLLVVTVPERAGALPPEKK
jgi:YVTN family beta-propeller protein